MIQSREELPPPITLGQIVLWCSDAHLSGRNAISPGEIHPAIITRILDPNTLNLTIFPDGGFPTPVTNVHLDNSQTQPNSWSRTK